MEILELRGLNVEYFKVNDDQRKEMFYDEESNNLIIFNPVDEECSTESICNGIREEAYMYLMNVLNTEKNIIVEWMQIEGTTSDYTIFYGLDVKKLKQMKHDDASDYLDRNSAKFDKWLKYMQVKDGVAYPIEFKKLH